jgi:hypothetical protein
MNDADRNVRGLLQPMGEFISCIELIVSYRIPLFRDDSKFRRLKFTASVLEKLRTAERFLKMNIQSPANGSWWVENPPNEKGYRR